MSDELTQAAERIIDKLNHYAMGQSVDFGLPTAYVQQMSEMSALVATEIQTVLDTERERIVKIVEAHKPKYDTLQSRERDHDDFVRESLVRAIIKEIDAEGE